MKKLLAAAVALGFASTAVAGPYSSKEVLPPPPPPPIEDCVCFAGDALTVSIFGGGMIPSNKTAELDDAIGGGIGLGYFFTENFGIEVNYGVYDQTSAAHLITANAVVRAPLGDLCIAPYFLAGGGLHTNSVEQGIWNVGGGIDWRFDSAGCYGIFADAVYTWANDTEDYTVIRVGLRRNF